MHTKTRPARPRRAHKALLATTAVLAVGAGAALTTSAPAHAWSNSGRVIPIIRACPGGRPVQGQFYGNESGWTIVYDHDNQMAASLWNVPTSGTSIKFGVQCDNGRWYYSNWRTVKRPANSVYVDLGWM